MWQELWIALALLLVIEGILPFISPKGLRESLLKMACLSDRTLRIGGLVCMVSGVLLLYLVR
ncbi:MAG: DUF2065 domain-containing protein [Thiotrichaceae bacterium]|nr:DUF2065 domain-containing protein [Thiotrichaceae bacterium]PCI13605.1 MAG: hypothetical protein COB71_05540 [Thiotrichales bacterium]